MGIKVIKENGGNSIIWNSFPDFESLIMKFNSCFQSSQWDWRETR